NCSLKRRAEGLNAADRVDETTHHVGILFAGSALDPAGDVNGVRTDDVNRVGDVFRREASREDERHARLELGEQLPWGDLARAAVPAGDMRIDEDGSGNGAGELKFFKIGRDVLQTGRILHGKCRDPPHASYREYLMMIAINLNRAKGQRLGGSLRVNEG